MDRKLYKLRKDDNRVDKGDNWPVFDFCNQFLQTSNELTKARDEKGLIVRDEQLVWSLIKG